MSNSKIPSNGVWAPFLGDQDSIIIGLDQLGLQGVPEATFQKLLFGLNNVTGRIRYYSFYCWLLDVYIEGIGGRYAKEGASTDPVLQRRFIRTGEFIMAMIGQHPDLLLTNIPGSTFARSNWERSPHGPFDLSASIYNSNGGTENSYWKYSSGAFGQYYLGSMRDMRLVQLRSNDNGVFLRTIKDDDSTWVSGKELADAFASSIGEYGALKFLDAIRIESISKQTLDEIKGVFRPDVIPQYSTEHELLSRLICQSDDPLNSNDDKAPRLRSNTIGLYLIKFKQTQDASVAYWKEPYRRFTALAYLEGPESQDSTAWFGWYHYMFNELWQFACGALLSALLRSLSIEWKGMARKDAWIDKFASDIEQGLWLLEPEMPSPLTLNAVVDFFGAQREWSYVAQILNRSSAISEVSLAAVELIFTLMNRNGSSFDRLLEFDVNIIHKSHESPIRKLKSLKDEFGERPIRFFLVHFLNRHIVMLHHQVAIRKMRGRSQSSQKFMFESGWVRYINPSEATFMGPRLPNLVNFLEDLSLLDSNGQPTDLAERWMEKHLVN
jgi:hypothetical protein